MFYDHYRGRCTGRILGYLEIIDLRIAEQATIYGDRIEYFGKTIGTYYWFGDTDIAIINFSDKYHQVQYVKEAWLIDNRDLRYNVSYTLQEMSRYIKYNLAGDELIKKLLLSWWYPATKEDIEEHYELMYVKCLWILQNYY